jgi:hypothetical protein
MNWPRIYLMDKNQDAKSVNTINYPEDWNLDDDDDYFNMVGVNLRGRESKLRTTAQHQLQKDTGFQ